MYNVYQFREQLANTKLVGKTFLMYQFFFFFLSCLEYAVNKYLVIINMIKNGLIFIFIMKFML